MSNRSVVAVYNTHHEAESGIKALQISGVDMTKLSIVGKDFQTEENVVGYYNAGDRIKVWGKLGAFWGGLWGLFMGSGLFLVPGFGPILVFGPLAAMIIGALEGAVVAGGLSAVGAGLYSIGIPKDSIVKYEFDLKNGKFLVVAHGSEAELEKVQSIFAETAAAKTEILCTAQ